MKSIPNAIKQLFKPLISEEISYRIFLYRWRKRNHHNKVKPVRSFPLDSVTVGVATYGNLNVFSLCSNNCLKIGNYCSIAEEVTFLLNIDHDYKKVSTFPFRTLNKKEGTDVINNGDIIIDDDVWIGYRSIIMSGVHIGQGAIIGAGSIVTHDIPPYSIACGTPAKVIKKRFSESIIEVLLNIDYSSINFHSEMLDSAVNEDNCYQIVQSLKL